MSCFGLRPSFHARHLGLADAIAEATGSQRFSSRRNHTFTFNSSSSSPSRSPSASSSPLSGIPAPFSGTAPPPPPEDLHATKRRLVVIRRQPSYAPLSLSVGFRSRTGWQPLCSSRHNQDAIVVLLPLPEPLTDYSLFAVFDGHGRAAHRVSAFVAESLAYNLRHALFNRDSQQTSPFYDQNNNNNTSNRSSNNSSSANNASVPSALYRACLRASADLHANGTLDLAMTGTTAAAMVVHGRTLTCANIGDSRIVLGTRERDDTTRTRTDHNTQQHRDQQQKQQQQQNYFHHRQHSTNNINTRPVLRAVALTNDHLPNCEAEKRRVEDAGGRVDSWSPAGPGTGPLRVWLKERRMPGLAVTRVIGDSMLSGIVKPEPEITTHEIMPGDAFCVVATDGIWSVMSNHEVVNFVDDRAQMSSQAVTEDLIRHAAALWSEQDGESVDDISAIVVRFKNP